MLYRTCEVRALYARRLSTASGARAGFPPDETPTIRRYVLADHRLVRARTILVARAPGPSFSLFDAVFDLQELPGVWSSAARVTSLWSSLASLLCWEPTSSWFAAKALSLRGFDENLRQAIACSSGCDEILPWTD